MKTENELHADMKNMEQNARFSQNMTVRQRKNFQKRLYN